MKFKKMMLAVFLVGLLTISAVTAANNATDDTGFVEKTVDEVVNDNWMIGDNESDEDSSELSDLFDDEMNEEDIDLTATNDVFDLVMSIMLTQSMTFINQ